MNMHQFYSKINKLSFVTRYSNVERIRDENVAQHSFFVAAIVIKLSDDYEFELEAALVAAISHDFGEADLGDITYRVKCKYPEIGDAVLSAEVDVLAEYPKRFRSGFAVFNSSIVEGHIVQLADAIQVKQYCESEVALGNLAMDRIVANSQQRIDDLKEVLKPYAKRHSKNID